MQAKGSTNHQSRHGFTLIEIFVVMTIISILAALIIPQFKRAHERADVIVCLNNMKEMCVAFEMYLNSSDAWYPLCGWAFDADDYPPYPAGPVGQCWQDAIAPYLDWKEEIFICPSDPDPEDFEWFCWAGHSAFSKCSYASNEDIMGIDNEGNKGVVGGRGRLGGDGRKVKNPSKCALIVDGNYLWVNTHTWNLHDRLLHNHVDGFNAIFCDSHASWIAKGKMDQVTLDMGHLY